MRLTMTLSLLSLLSSLLFLLAAQGVAAHPTGMNVAAREARAGLFERSLKGEGNVHLAARDDTTNVCSMTGNMGRGQSASWTATLAMSCCSTWNVSTCYQRTQADYNATEQCIIPSCSDLSSGNSDLMHGFTPLSSTIGIGTKNNSYLITTSGALGLFAGRYEAMAIVGMAAALLGALSLL
ncbi:hypothetical protein BCV69DRAFT_284784 [Microstroma glucosiphilum]|uniref:Uncharacterized protein n=1 Tax=Pseudomicrostroma glucosiphilum TaxID=1684307 RepID=A0A316U068_9BASI|nr:hypothetical protein BCV69DRAFT_284784 [Pseudomicrostroma glucosiphilum]PWN18802.1 hypothetical protein BCV69DRAFT_284784 [Pseudomicrostroma glucosiphilum]